MILDGNSKYCPDCKTELPKSAFTKNARSRDGLAFYCAVCARRRHVTSRRARLGPPKTRNRQGPQDVPPGMKWCSECNETKPTYEFPRNRSQTNGLGTYCKPCHNLIVERNRNKRGGTRDYHLRHRYGITAAEADLMLSEQNGLCAICLEAPAVHVDHDHATGLVRGLLCFNCNGALGQFRDRADLMSRAALYLSSGAGAVAAADGLEYEVGPATDPSPRPEDEDSSYLFDFLDEVTLV